MFGKLIRFCMKSTSLQGLVDIDFMQFADHFNNPAFHAETTVNALDDKLRTMLHQAASKGATHIVSNLLQNGASTHLVDKYGFNAYGLAMREDQF
jgi:ankyrin repeat protein